MRTAFMGSKDLGLRVLDRMLRAPDCELTGILCADDANDPRSRLEEFRRLASEKDLELVVEQRAKEVEEILRGWSPELVVVSGWYRRVPVERLPEVLFVGFHASPLPRYRGGAPLTWQILEGEPEVGLTFFQLVPGIDEGPIVGQATTPLGPDATIADALDWVETAAVELLDDHLPALLAGTAELREQDHAEATWCAQRQPEDGAVDWRLEAVRVHDFVRAQTRPYPGAFCTLPDGGRLTIWRTARDERPYLGTPGAVVERADGAALVACGEGAVWVVEAQREGTEPEPGDSALGSLTIRLR